MPITSSILWGFIRLCFMLLFIYYLNRKLVNRSASNNFLEFLVWQWFRYGSIMGALIFASIQLGIYNLINAVIILLLIIAADYIGLENLKHPRRYYEQTVRANVNLLLKRMENNYSNLAWWKFGKRTKKGGGKPRGIYILLLVIAIAALTFASRVYFFNYDSYSLSPVWISDLETIIGFDSQQWFNGQSTVVGDLAYVNLYGKIASVTPEIALQSIGILESVLLSVLIFWVVSKITRSRQIAPTIAALVFGMVYTLSPINIYFVLQNRPIFLAMTFGLPLMVYFLRPGMLKMNKLQFFLSFLMVFFAIGLIDLFTLCVLFPPFMLTAMFFARKKSGNFKWIGLLAYVSSVVLIIGMYVVIGNYFNTDMSVFIHSNLLSVSSYTYIPQLVMDLDVLLGYYQIASGIAVVLLLVYTIFAKEDWRAAFAFVIYFNLLLLLKRLNSAWIDDDLLTQGLAVFMPIVAGIGIAVLIRPLVPIFSRFYRWNPAVIAAIVIGCVYAANTYQKKNLTDLTESDPAQREVLEAYDFITRDYFPFSYAVVNTNATQVLSIDKHFFMNYSDFLYDYPRQDSIYFENRNKPNFAKEHPEDIIPKSIMVFVFDRKLSSDSEEFGENGELNPILMDQLALLRKKGRQIKLFYNNKNVKVYEIVNEPGQSRISDLIY